MTEGSAVSRQVQRVFDRWLEPVIDADRPYLHVPPHIGTGCAAGERTGLDGTRLYLPVHLADDGIVATGMSGRNQVGYDNNAHNG